MKVIKCQPPKSPYHKRDFSVCTEPKAFDPLFIENVKDIADTMAEIMIICGIHRCKAKASRGIVVKAFQFYDIRRHRFEVAENERSIYREDIVGDFERKCLMTRVEALLAYCIVKRAVKAFYHGTPEHSIRSPVTEAVVLKQQEFAWLHAAKRTIVLFERYEHMFFNAQRNYAQQILNINKELHSRLKNRADPVIIEDYHPRGCVKKIIVGTRSAPHVEIEKPKCAEKCKKSQDLREYIENIPPKVMPIKSCLTLPRPCAVLCQNQHEITEASEDSTPLKKKQKKTEVKNRDLNLPRCVQCNCPQVICDCDINRDTGVVAIDCSQGPFECQWVRIDEDDEPDPCIEKREFHQCPVDCGTSESSCESDSTEYCECSAESDKDDNSSDGGNDMVKKYEGSAANNGEATLEKMMPMNLPRRRTNTACQFREISKLPLPKCIR